jgi:hypothetical protein
MNIGPRLPYLALAVGLLTGPSAAQIPPKVTGTPSLPAASASPAASPGTSTPLGAAGGYGG